jgi:hypothetical protein
MFRIAASDGLFSDWKPVGRFRGRLLNFNLFDSMGISVHPSVTEVPSGSYWPMSLARMALWPTRTVFRRATSAHFPRRRIGEQYSQVPRDRSELLDAAILCKRREKIVAARGHASWQEGECVDEAGPLSIFAIRIRQFDPHVSQFSSRALSAGMFLSLNPPTL